LSAALLLSSVVTAGNDLVIREPVFPNVSDPIRFASAEFGWAELNGPLQAPLPPAVPPASPSDVIPPPQPAEVYFVPEVMGGCDDCHNPICDTCPNWGLYAFMGYDAWRGVPDGSWEHNGIHTGLNYGTRLGRFSELTGVGFQLGGSVGVYDFNGSNYRLRNNDQSQPQGFVTYGFFRKANENSPWSAAVVQDWMLNANYSVFGENPTLSQWRGQIGYAISPWSEYGIWAAWRGQGDTRVVPGFGPVTWRSVQQVSGYWHYKWGEGGTDTWLWLGLPEEDRLAGNGSLGDYYIGTLATVPLGERLSLYAQLSYMHPSARPGPAGSMEDSWNFTMGIAFYPRWNARTSTVAGQCWMPQLPVANNGYFLVDASQNY